MLVTISTLTGGICLPRILACGDRPLLGDHLHSAAGGHSQQVNNHDGQTTTLHTCTFPRLVHPRTIRVHMLATSKQISLDDALVLVNAGGSYSEVFLILLVEGTWDAQAFGYLILRLVQAKKLGEPTCLTSASETNEEFFV